MSQYDSFADLVDSGTNPVAIKAYTMIFKIRKNVFNIEENIYRYALQLLSRFNTLDYRYMKFFYTRYGNIKESILKNIQQALGYISNIRSSGMVSNSLLSFLTLLEDEYAELRARVLNAWWFLDFARKAVGMVD